jgi:ferric-dicitrate binding protein FerR (iron transport regulator)
MADNKKKKEERTKAKIVEWMLNTLFSDKHIPEENMEAFHKWLIENSNVDVKAEGLRRVIEEKSRTAFSMADVNKRSEVTRESWRDMAPRIGMDPELNNYRNLRAQRDRFGSVIRSEQMGIKPFHKSTETPMWRKYAMRAAAVLLPVIMIAGGYLLLDDSRKDTQTNIPVTVPVYVATESIFAGQDSIRHITLSDGTRVTLNRNSTLSYNENREAMLSGEAYFKVAKDSEHPFVIHSDKLKVTVLGTEFNFRADAEKSILSLYEGSVLLDYAAGSRRLDAAGKEFSLDNTTGQAVVHNFDISVEPEWVAWDNFYKYYSLSEIFGVIEAEYGIRFKNLNTIDTTQTISFRLQNNTSLEALMSVLKRASGDFDYTINGDTITLSPQKK